MALTQEKNQKTSSMKSIKSHTSDGKLSSELLEDQGLGRRFLDKLLQSKDKIHQVDAGTGLTETNGSIRLRSIQVAMEMQSRGIHENDIILICSKAHSDQTVVVLATLLVGAIVAPLDPEANPAEIKTMVLNLKPKMAFCDVRACRQLEVTIKDTEAHQCLIVVFGHTDRFMFEKFLIQKPNPDFKAVVIKDTKRRVAFVIPSQSTTGPSKLVCISHNSMRMQVATYGNRILKGAEKVLSFFPLSWITQVAIICYCFEAPITRIIPGVFSERSACKLIHDLRIDFALLGTDYAMKMIRHVSHQDYDLSCLKTVYVGGFITSAMDMAYLRTSFSTAKVFQCYGMTEMSCLVAAFPVDDYESALERPGSVGKLMPGVKIKIVDFETRETLAADWWGELLVTGPTLMLGYYKDLPGTNASLEKGYFRTGDVAQWDTDGYLYIQGRLSDYLLSQGVRFFPSELEEMILTHPSVREAVVLGNGKDVVACVIKNPGSRLEVDELMEYIDDRMPENKRPTKIKFFESFPRTSVGKVKKDLIRQMVLGVTIVHSKSVVSFEGNSTNNDNNQK